MRSKHLYFIITLFLALSLVGCGAAGGGDAPPPAPTDNPSLAQDLPQATPVPDSSAPDEVLVEEVEEASDATPTAVPPAATGETIVNDQVTSGDGQLGITSFTSPADQVVQIEAIAIDGAGSFEISIRDKFNSLLATVESEPLEPSVLISEILLPYDGDYDILVNAVDTILTVEVTVSVLEAPSATGTITEIGESIDASITEVNTFHVYDVTLTEGDLVSLGAVAADAELLAPDLDLKMSLFGPDGALVTDIDDAVPASDLNPILNAFAVPQSGDYVAVVSNVAGSAGDYQFRLRSDAEAMAAEDPPDVVYNSEYEVLFTDGDNLVAEFDGAIGDVLQILVDDVAFGLDVAVYLYNPVGQVIAFASNDGTGRAETITEVQLPYTGRYELEIRPTGNGTATFAILPLTIEDLTGGGVFGEEAEGSRLGEFTEESAFHMYQFSATAGDAVTIQILNDNQASPNTFSNQLGLDIGFALLAPNGEQVTFADDLDPETNVDAALEDFIVEQTGSYIVVVYSFTGGEGRYELTYSKN